MSHRKVDIDLLRRQLLRTRRVIAHPRPPLVEFLRSRIGASSAPPRLLVRDIVSAGPDAEIMCCFVIDGDSQMRAFVAPLSQLSLGRQWRLLPSHRQRSPQFELGQTKMKRAQAHLEKTEATVRIQARCE